MNYLKIIFCILIITNTAFGIENNITTKYKFAKYNNVIKNNLYSAYKKKIKQSVINYNKKRIKIKHLPLLSLKNNELKFSTDKYNFSATLSMLYNKNIQINNHLFNLKNIKGIPDLKKALHILKNKDSIVRNILSIIIMTSYAGDDITSFDTLLLTLITMNKDMNLFVDNFRTSSDEYAKDMVKIIKKIDDLGNSCDNYIKNNLHSYDSNIDNLDTEAPEFFKLYNNISNINDKKRYETNKRVEYFISETNSDQNNLCSNIDNYIKNKSKMGVFDKIMSTRYGGTTIMAPSEKTEKLSCSISLYKLKKCIAKIQKFDENDDRLSARIFNGSQRFIDQMNVGGTYEISQEYKNSSSH